LALNLFEIGVKDVSFEI